MCTESNENIRASDKTKEKKQQNGTVSKQTCTLLQLSSFAFWEGAGWGYKGLGETSRTVHSPLCCWQCRPCLPPACLPPPGEVFCRCLPQSWHGLRPTCPQSPGWLCRSCRWLCLCKRERENFKNVMIITVYYGDEVGCCHQQNELPQECYVAHSPTRFLGTWK